MGVHRLICVLSCAILCCSCISYPRDYHLYYDLKAFKARPLEQISGDSYRLVWHAWHKRPGLILVNCAGSCYLEMRYTNGYGTYEQGTLDGVLKTTITRLEFLDVAKRFKDGKFESLRADLKGIAAEVMENSTRGICLHAPYYYLESYVKKEYNVIYRHCQESYLKDFAFAFPMIELAERYFPDEITLIKASWLDKTSQEEGDVN